MTRIQGQYHHRLSIGLLLSLSLSFATVADAALLSKSVSQCFRTSCSVVLGAVCLPTQILDLILRQLPNVEETRSGRKILFRVTDRTPLHYFDMNSLYLYDFSGKKILDIGAGKSRFSQVINATYGDTGTSVDAVDLYATPPLFSFPGKYMKADAFNLPFADATYDLTVNNWMLIYYLPREDSPQEIESAKHHIRQLLTEQLRVTAKGGSARVYLSYYHPHQDVAAFLRQYLNQHERVENYSFVKQAPLPLMSLEIKLKIRTSANDNPNTSKEILRNRRLAPFQTLQWALGFYLLYSYFFT